MKLWFSLIFSLFFVTATAQNKIENVIIVTTDGLRWQEVFKGMDSAIANDRAFNEGKGKEIFRKYWAENATERRKQLLPFFWNVLTRRGQLYGNRDKGNRVDVSNPYWFSYPGYSEIFCGYVDTLISSNGYKANPNSNVLAFIHKQAGYKNKVMAFGAWEAFDRILNEQVSGFPVISGFDSVGGKHPDERAALLNNMIRDSYKIFGTAEVADVFTHYSAMEALKKDKPRVLYIAYGETDEFAHEGKYHSYLDAAHQFDKWLNAIWNYIQSKSRYKNKTALFITTDHGRGHKVKSQWTDHGSNIEGSNEIWFGVIGPGIAPKGAVEKNMHVYQKQFAQTIAALPGFTFTAAHPVAGKVDAVFEK